jgi:methylphosphotriester-DNA--protein-cysteine methyltransferase
VVVVIGNNILQGVEFPTDRFLAEIAQARGFEVVQMHEVRRKRTGNSIIASSVRVAAAQAKVRLHETAVELRAPLARQ